MDLFNALQGEFNEHRPTHESESRTATARRIRLPGNLFCLVFVPVIALPPLPGFFMEMKKLKFVVQRQEKLLKRCSKLLSSSPADGVTPDYVLTFDGGSKGNPGWGYIEDPYSMLECVSYMTRELRNIAPRCAIMLDMAGRASLFMVATAIILGLIGVRVGMEDAVYMYPHKDEKIKEKLNIENVRLVCGKNKKIKKIGIINGSGASLMRKVRSKGVDLFITADIKYHEALDAMEDGMNILDIGHYESEIFFSDLIKTLIEDIVEVEIFSSKPVFKFM